MTDGDDTLVAEAGGGGNRISFAEKVARREQILGLREKKWTLKRIGELHGVSRQRIYQIINTPVRERAKRYQVDPNIVKAREQKRHRLELARKQMIKAIVRLPKRKKSPLKLDADLAAKFAKIYRRGMSANRLATIAGVGWVYAKRWLTARTLAAPQARKQAARRGSISPQQSV